jgi:hypothetical protein
VEEMSSLIYYCGDISRMNPMGGRGRKKRKV